MLSVKDILVVLIWEVTFFEISLLVLALDQVHQGIVDANAVGKEECGSGRCLIEEEKLLVLTNLSVVALGGLGQEVLVLLESLLVRE